MYDDNDVGILTFVPDVWEDYWMPRHHIMSRLSQHYKVLWVSPSLGWRQTIRYGYKSTSPRGVKRISPTFWVYSPERYLPSVSPVYSGPLYGFLDAMRVKRIKSLLNAMKIKRLILYVWRHDFVSYVGKFNEDLLCYHIDDEYTFSEIDLPVREEEINLLKRSNIVFIHSKTLLEKKGSINKETYYVPNGVNFDHYRKIAEDGKIHLCEFEKIPHPRIGYVGYLKSEIDLELLLEIARKRKDWSIVLVGYINKSHKNIEKHIELLRCEKNVYFLGGKKPEDLPKYMKEMDVCLMCYRKTGYTNYIYPMKLHEYLACGKPIVATCVHWYPIFIKFMYLINAHIT